MQRVNGATAKGGGGVSPCKLETPASFMGTAGGGGGMGRGKRICFMALTGTPIMV